MFQSDLGEDLAKDLTLKDKHFETLETIHSSDKIVLVNLKSDGLRNPPCPAAVNGNPRRYSLLDKSKENI